MQFFLLFVRQRKCFLRLHSVICRLDQEIPYGKYTFAWLAFGRYAPCHFHIRIGLAVDDRIDAHRSFDLWTTLFLGRIYGDTPTFEQQFCDIFLLCFECEILFDSLRNGSRIVDCFDVYLAHLDLQLGCRIVTLIDRLALLCHYKRNTDQIQAGWRHIITHNRYENCLLWYRWCDLNLFRDCFDRLVECGRIFG